MRKNNNLNSIRRPYLFWIGIAIGLTLLVSYFITLNVDSGANYSVDTPLLGILIFYSPWILALYIVIALVFVWLSFYDKN